MSPILFRSGYERFSRHLPRGIQQYVEEVLGFRKATFTQMRRIETLGKSIGLHRGEIIAATSLPIDNMDARGRGSVGVLGVMIAIFVVLCISFALVILMTGGSLVDPVATPTYTYAPGTRYGTIAPRDFQY
jgi:hypothetical protein